MSAVTTGSYRRQSVPVAGGELTVGVWGDEGPLVVLVHGITSSHMAYGLIGPMLAEDRRAVGVDLRGRGGSRELPPPYGMAAHADDIAAVVEAYGGGPAVLVGHSMGAWAVLETARSYPMSVRRLVLVDGGAPLPLPPGVSPDASEAELAEAIASTLGPAYARLSMTFATRDEYRAMWRAHPSFADWNDAMDAYVDYDLVGEEPQLRPACRLEAALRDAQDLYAVAGVEPAAPPVPSVFLRAERGMFNGAPMYPAGEAARWLPGIQEITVADVNHYTITLCPTGADAVVAAVRSLG
ncbi:MAG TPA: alpha/beta hydrolase [Micromonosporaceae bacterium]|nr:alpha/beta hydrolase [Micromonosporaceae bacterium]